MVNDGKSAQDPSTIADCHGIESIRIRLARIASTLFEAQEIAASNLQASQSAVAGLLSLSDAENATTLLEAQEASASKLLASQASVAELLRAHDVTSAPTLLKAQDESMRPLLESQSAVAGILRARNTEGTSTLRDAQSLEASNLLASQSAVAGLLRSRNIENAEILRKAQEVAADDLLAAQSKVAELLRSHNREVASLTALVAELEQVVQEHTEELTLTNTRLEQATRAKSDFLASMSHALRTPLNIVIGLSGFLETGMVGELDSEQQKQVEMINGAGRHLLELVNEVLDLSSIEAGHARIDLRQIDVSLTVGRVAESLAVSAREKQLDLSWDVAPEARSMVTDCMRLEQVLFNLIGNAVKFTDSGSVQINVSRDNAHIVLAVTDTGQGIPEKDLERIFDEFYRVESPHAAAEGTGLGLAVSRRIVELLGGTIGVESTLGEGATFTVRLPAEARTHNRPESH